MGLGGVLFAGVAIVGVVLVANGRWPAVWDAMLGNAGGASAPSASNVSTASDTSGVSTVTYA